MMERSTHGDVATGVGARQPGRIGSGLTLVDVLRRRAQSVAGRTAYTFLVDGEHDERRLSYADLDAEARRIAVALATRAAARARALLVFEPGLEFIAGLFGCFFAGVIAVPVYPPEARNMASGLRRLRRIAADAGASVVLTTGALRTAIERWSDTAPGLMQLEWCASDALSVGSEIGWRAPRLERDQVAFLQYTSGSTGAPKGVMVTHGNIIAHGEGVTTALSLTPRTVMVSWLPLFHDMGLVGTVLIPMQVGCHSVQMPPLAFLERPLRWLRALSRYGGTLSPAPNFAYELAVRRTTPADRRGLDLGAWATAMNGAEPVRAESCERFIAAFEPCGFRREALVPCYGLAEATLMVAGGPSETLPTALVVDGGALAERRVVEATPGTRGARAIMGCGRIVPGLEVVIVHPEARTECAAGEVGEIWVAGASIAAGYWGHAEDTAAVFGACLADSGRGPFLRTGDLGFVRHEVVFVTGRHKDLIVIRGRNYYPQDLEDTAARAHAALRPGCGVAFSLDESEEERLVIVHEIESDAATLLDEAAMAVRNAIAREYELYTHAVVLIRPRTLPKTSSGKVRRRACRASFAAGGLQVLGGWHADLAFGEPGAIDVDPSGAAVAAAARPSVADIGAWLVTTIAELRGLSRDEVHRDDALVALGVDSAEVAQVAAGLECWLARPVPLRLFLEHPTIETLALALGEASA